MNCGFLLLALNLILWVAPEEPARRRGERGTHTRLQDGDELGALADGAS
ncbi:hypothetical protein [Actinomadura sp. 6N118]